MTYDERIWDSSVLTKTPGVLPLATSNFSLALHKLIPSERSFADRDFLYCFVPLVEGVRVVHRWSSFSCSRFFSTIGSEKDIKELGFLSVSPRCVNMRGRDDSLGGLGNLSRPVDVAGASSCFTTLPIRLSHNARLADEGTRKLLSDYQNLDRSNARAFSTSDLTINPAGNFSALLYPETVAGRLEPISYLNSLVFLHDGMLPHFNSPASR